MLFIYYPKCSTCVKAKNKLDEYAVSYTERHIKESCPTIVELKEWHKRSGLPLKKFFNTSGLLYRTLGLKEKLPLLSDEEQYELLASDGMMIKRPILIHDSGILIGFKEHDWDVLLRSRDANT